MDTEKRFEQLIECALESEVLWSLEEGGRLIRLRLPDGRLALPLWPSLELAALESPGPSESPKALGLDELLDATLPQLITEAALIAAFPQKGEGLVLEAFAFLQRLEEEWESQD
jgi:hypothetical protein